MLRNVRAIRRNSSTFDPETSMARPPPTYRDTGVCDKMVRMCVRVCVRVCVCVCVCDREERERDEDGEH